MTPTKLLAHDVYFELHDASPAACEALVEACWQFLSEGDGIRLFAAGTRVEEHWREVNASDFQVSLQVHFDSREAHDRYQVTELHKRFIEENQANWKSVRVFDSWVRAVGGI